MFRLDSRHQAFKFSRHLAQAVLASQRNTWPRGRYSRFKVGRCPSAKFPDIGGFNLFLCIFLVIPIAWSLAKLSNTTGISALWPTKFWADDLSAIAETSLRFLYSGVCPEGATGLILLLDFGAPYGVIDFGLILFNTTGSGCHVLMLIQLLTLSRIDSQLDSKQTNGLNSRLAVFSHRNCIQMVPDVRIQNFSSDVRMG